MSNLLEVNSLNVQFNYDETTVQAVKNVSFELRKKHILGIVGESGSGKSITAKSILGLLPDYPDHTLTGEIIFDGKVLTELTSASLRQIRGKDISMIFQDPLSSLNPRLTIGKQITEVLFQHKRVSKSEAKSMAIDILDKVGIKDATRQFNAYPHELSGGMRQRVMIAIALILKPQILIADEPTTALDASTQNQLLQLMKSLYEYTETSIIFITHDLGAVYQFCDDVIVMKDGSVVESGTVESIFKSPQHTYTKRLIDAIPNIHQTRPPRQLSNDILLKFDHVSVDYTSPSGSIFRAVRDINLAIRKGETLGIVGESGSGKSTLGKTVVGLKDVSEGFIWYNNVPISLFNAGELKPLRQDIQMIFQDPFASINPRFKVIDVIKRALIIHEKVKDDDMIKTVVSLLEKVGLDQSFLYRYPHELSGGQRQRVSIARALAVEPKLIVCDEAVSALDVSIQKDIIDLLKQLQLDFGITYLFITHDMGVINEICDRVAVMKNGEIVELNNTEDIIKHPQSDYAKQLISAVPVITK
ncbi:TPA: ABC transporter ATP-binding protein [Staphylococcus argenteus]|uniref:ABC transporter ATP-binding protein n=1 Tax=Staphylococcus argenteus TaxID=985002 RepID=UPI0005051074|nr:ABC transporter ATP-binding protein [Staphylococcus argenteus]MBE2135511.1 ABC transporter ATP-binding protein [Staphylococcus argenteus]MCG9803481.1 ABC transporter ATP-binding protein [Staphylococcus argenteus]MCG9810227.1 ABC transporter ATP-binding protein [Staphylococcus argenteus]MCG9824065.1 ABC transporter ATP-binding protein [Staphylococcus argenteus]MDT3004596.1 ABC transporter ATP-binding protein [Staphylococcus argenteus]